MSIYSFISDAGKKFKITGPDGLSLEQAKAIFQKQDSTGSLVGLKPGDVLNAAKQAAGGLKSALSSVTQGFGKITGALGGGLSTSTGNVGSVLSGLGNKISSLTDKATSAASNLLKSVTSTTPTAGINTANFAKEKSAFGPIAGLATSAVTGIMAQQKKLVNQVSSAMTDAKGAGSYGLSLSKLESAGYLKPGTTAIATAAGTATTKILSSAKAFTGKDGVKDVNGLLKNESTQSSIQQGLMTKGTSALSAATGLDIKKLPAPLQGGIALASASALGAAKNLVNGLPIPAGAKSELDKIMSNGAFAVSFSDAKVPEAFKEQEVPKPATDTADRATVDAAANRAIGNDKIPKPNYVKVVGDNTNAEIEQINDAYSEAIGYIVGAIADITDIKNELVQLNQQSTVTVAEFTAVQAAYNRIKDDFSNRGVKLIAAVRQFRDSKSEKAQIGTNAIVTDFNKYSEEFSAVVKEAKALLAAVEAKVAR